MLSVVTFKWKTEGYRASFTSEHVNNLAAMVAKHYDRQHRFICVTDDPEGLECESVPLWDDYASVPNPTGGGRPSCYRRLKLFSPEMIPVIGERHVLLDLDCVVTGDLSPIFDRDEDIVLYKNPQGFWPYNGGLWLMDTGCRPEVWDDFCPDIARRVSIQKDYRGSDQSWISHKIPNEATFNENHGVHWYRKTCRRDDLPSGCRMVFFTADQAPWKVRERHRWIREHYPCQ